MDIRRRRIGTTTGHVSQASTLVEEYTLATGSGFSITVWTYGASLVEVLVPDYCGNAENVVLRLPNLRAYEDRGQNPYVGATLGRYARCVRDGQFRLDGEPHQLDRNYGRHHFHGGSIGFDRFVWDADAEVAHGEAVLRLTLQRPDGDQGYPGAVSVETCYRINSDRELIVEHRATTTTPTVVAMTNHAFWNLRGGGTIDGHNLTINATRVIPVDSELIPTGDPVDVGGTPLDFSTLRQIDRERLDHCFALRDSTWACEVFECESGRSMRVVTNQPGLALYSADHFVAARAGLCVQSTAWPDSPNHPDYPSSRLDPGVTYAHRTTHEFFVRRAR